MEDALTTDIEHVVVLGDLNEGIEAYRALPGNLNGCHIRLSW
jgi:hypothetical protein